MSMQQSVKKDRIRLSQLGSYYLGVVKSRLELKGQPNYVPMRIAFGRSIQLGEEPKYEEADEEVLRKAKNIRGNEQPYVSTFEQNHGLIFRALLTQKYQKRLEDNEYVELLTQHVEHGLYRIAKETDKLKGYDYISAILPELKDTEQGGKASGSNRPEEISGEYLLRLYIGKRKADQEPIHYEINLADNPHVAIMGGSGSGKTYFIKHLLKEIRKQSNLQTNFIIFDYKDGDIAKDKAFLNATQANLIDVKRTPIPLNLFAGVPADTEKEQKSRAEKIVDIVRNVEANIGKVQEQNLYQAILNAYDNNVPFPDFAAVRQELELINPRPDSLTSVFRPLVEQEYFVDKDKPVWNDWVNRTVVVDIHEIERKDLVCFFILSQVHDELKKLGPAPTSEESGARRLRTVVVIDEAHYFLASKKRAKILENMIRDVRSSGGAIVLASQSPDDYDKSDFNFLELIEYPVALGSTPRSGKFLEQKYGLSKQASNNLLKELGQLNRGEGYVLQNGNPVLVELCKP